MSRQILMFFHGQGDAGGRVGTLIGNTSAAGSRVVFER